MEKSVYQDYDSDSDVPDELKQDYVDEQTGDAPLKSVSRETIRSKKKSDYNLSKASAPILTNTTLNVIRLVGKYMQMMNILKPIAFDVIHCVSQLFDYYLYAVYTFFGRNDMPVPSPSLPTYSGREAAPARVVGPACLYESSGLGLISSRLRTTLNRIQESLIDMVGQLLSAPPYFFLCPLSSSLILFYQCLLTHLLSDTYMLSPSIFPILTLLFPLHASTFGSFPSTLSSLSISIGEITVKPVSPQMHYGSSLSGQLSPHPFYTLACSLSLF
ncbi:Syndetin [Xenoophorus captivus]|uniref:Syndetin n=1 Tax=Xenoophorus captivus TaxID=1517983 RepID=A0ABV0R567_9TELE